MSQKDARKDMELQRVQALCSQAAEGIKSGGIVLPETGRDAVWSILDTASTICAADHSKHVPGTRLDKNEEHLGATYHTATGGPFSIAENKH